MRSKKLLWAILVMVMVGFMSSCAVRDCAGRKKSKHPGGFWMQNTPEVVVQTKDV